MERSSPSRTAGAVLRKVKVAGTEYVLSRVDRVRRASDEEMVVTSRRRAPTGLAGDDRAAAMDAYVAGIASAAEWKSYYGSAWRLAFRFWNALDFKDRQKHLGHVGKEPSELLEGVEWAFETLRGFDVTADEVDILHVALDVVSQESWTSFCSGLDSGAEATPPQAPQVLAAGQQYTTGDSAED